jgi:uracil-DNA glycosylase
MTPHPNAPPKQERYAALVRARKQCLRCDGLRNPADDGLSQFDSEQIGPWSRLHGDLDADLMIVGQDWGDVNYYTANRGLDDLQNRTMRALEQLLCGIGLSVSLAEYGTAPSGLRLFLTNAVLCLKEGGMTARVEEEWFKNCGANFLRQQIEIVASRVVVALGQVAYKAVLAGFGLPAESGPFRAAVEKPGITLPNGSLLLAVYHCAPGVINRTRSFAEQQQDWQRVANALQQR